MDPKFLDSRFPDFQIPRRPGPDLGLGLDPPAKLAATTSWLNGRPDLWRAPTKAHAAGRHSERLNFKSGRNTTDHVMEKKISFFAVGGISDLVAGLEGIQI